MLGGERSQQLVVLVHALAPVARDARVLALVLRPPGHGRKQHARSGGARVGGDGHQVADEGVLGPGGRTLIDQVGPCVGDRGDLAQIGHVAARAQPGVEVAVAREGALEEVEVLDLPRASPVAVVVLEAGCPARLEVVDRVVQDHEVGGVVLHQGEPGRQALGGRPARHAGVVDLEVAPRVELEDRLQLVGVGATAHGLVAALGGRASPAYDARHARGALARPLAVEEVLCVRAGANRPAEDRELGGLEAVDHPVAAQVAARADQGGVGAEASTEETHAQLEHQQGAEHGDQGEEEAGTQGARGEGRAGRSRG